VFWCSGQSSCSKLGRHSCQGFGYQSFSDYKAVCTEARYRPLVVGLRYIIDFHTHDLALLIQHAESVWSPKLGTEQPERQRPMVCPPSQVVSSDVEPSRDVDQARSIAAQQCIIDLPPLHDPTTTSTSIPTATDPPNSDLIQTETTTSNPISTKTHPSGPKDTDSDSRMSSEGSSSLCVLTIINSGCPHSGGNENDLRWTGGSQRHPQSFNATGNPRYPPVVLVSETGLLLP